MSRLRVLSIALTLGIALGSLSLFAGPIGRAFAASVFFNGYGVDTYTAYGPNETITISGDLAGTPDGCINLGTFSASVYIVPHGSVDPGTRQLMLQIPGDVITSAATNGLFVDETIGFTAPSGKIGDGDYDIVLDLCSDGFYDPGVDFIAGVNSAHGAFTVAHTATIPDLPTNAFQAVKSAAGKEALQWGATTAAMGLLFYIYNHYAAWVSKAGGGNVIDSKAIIEQIDKICSNWPSNLLPNYPTTTLCKNSGIFNVGALEKSVVRLMLAETAHYAAIYNDPPDPNFTAPAPLDSTDNFLTITSDPWEASVTQFGDQISVEQATLAALLHSIERYQGAEQAGNAVAALQQAQKIQQYATLAAAGMPTTSSRLGDVATATTNSGRDYAGEAAFEASLLARWQSSGFSPTEVADLKSLGLGDGEISNALQRLIAPAGPDTNYTLDAWQIQGDIQTNSQQQQTVNADTATSLQGLATAMGPVIAQLQGEMTAPTLPTADAGGPYTGTVGMPIAFDASASTTPANTGALIYAWDLTGSGTFTDAR